MARDRKVHDMEYTQSDRSGGTAPTESVQIEIPKDVEAAIAGGYDLFKITFLEPGCQT